MGSILSQSTIVSILTPTVRHDGLTIVEKSIRRQTYKSIEWIIGSPTKPENVKHPFTWVKDPDKKDGDIWTLNKCYNEMIRKATGDIIVSWQDWTYADPDAIEKFVYHHSVEPKTLVSGVGNKYTDDSWTVQTWQDPRMTDIYGSCYQCYFPDIEWNFCSVPKDALYSVGGFDESLDAYFGMDGYSVNERISILGSYDFKLDQTIKTYSLGHGRPPMWEERNALHGPYQQKKTAYIENPRLPYLQ